MEIFDISRPLTPRTAPWPGDTAFSLRWSLRMADGESVNLSALTTSPHVGTHADAPLHVRDGAAGIGTLALAPYVGPARVLDVSPGADGLIAAEALQGIDFGDPARVLFRTGTDPDSERWPERFAALSEGAAALLATSGAVLVGVDTPSIDDPHSKTLPAHHVLLDAGVRWLENLDLGGVDAGLYELVALPLRMPDADASPVRAVLIRR